MMKDSKIRKYTDIEESKRATIREDIEKLMEKHGRNAVRLIASRLFEKVLEQERIQKEIDQKQKELEELKKQAK